MLTFLAENWGTLLVGLALAAVIVLIAGKLVRDRRKGKTACGCGCAGCPGHAVCHQHHEHPSSTSTH